jgi:hypothetical protein
MILQRKRAFVRSCFTLGWMESILRNSHHWHFYYKSQKFYLFIHIIFQAIFGCFIYMYLLIYFFPFRHDEIWFRPPFSVCFRRLCQIFTLMEEMLQTQCVSTCASCPILILATICNQPWDLETYNVFVSNFFLVYHILLFVNHLHVMFHSDYHLIN